MDEMDIADILSQEIDKTTFSGVNHYANPLSGNYVYPTSAAANPFTNTTFAYNYGNTISGTTLTDTKFRVSQDAEFSGNITWQGRDLGKMIATIESRLSILTPDPKKLEKYEALRNAYEHYLLMEKLIGED
jgi:hypothetical protein